MLENSSRPDSWQVLGKREHDRDEVKKVASLDIYLGQDGKSGSDGMVQYVVESPATSTDSLSSIPGTHMAGENQLSVIL